MEPVPLFFDLLIAILFVATGSVAYFALRARWRFVGWLAVAAVLTLTYGSFVEPRLLVVRHEDVKLGGTRRLAEPIKIALISDMHIGPYKRHGWVRRVVKKIKKEAPDLVVIAGDSVYTDTTNPEQYLAGLAELTRTIPTYAAVGNHDLGHNDESFFYDDEHARAVIKALTDAGVTVLRNENRTLDVRTSKITIAGLEEYRTGESSFEDALRSAPEFVPRIIAAHHPDPVTDAPMGLVDLMLAGHVHGGQVRIPFLAPLVRLPSILGQKFDRGLFRVAGTQIYITSGVGESGPRARLFMPPEIVILTIK